MPKAKIVQPSHPLKKTAIQTHRISAFCLFLTLSACGEKPSDMGQMADKLTATLKEVASAEDELNNDTALSDFGEAIRQAVEANEGYRAALALEQEMTSRVEVAASQRRLQISGNTTMGGLREEGGSQVDETTTGIAAGISISQLVYDGGESSSNINRATAEALGARAERIVRGNDIALDAARAWIDVWQFRARLSLLNTRTAEIETFVAQIQRMASNGMIHRAALNSAQRKIVDISLERARLQADKSQAEIRFRRLFNQRPNAVPQPAELFNVSQVRNQAEAWQNAPALQRSAAELISARSAVAGAQAAFKPRAKLQAGVTSPMEGDESTDTSIGLMLEYTIGDGGRREAQLEAAEARVKALEAQLQDALRTLEAEMATALHQLTTIDKSRPLVKEQLRLSKSEAQTAQSQLATGQSDLRQVVEATIENYRAEDRQIEMQAERSFLLLSISARTGALANALGLPSN